MQDLLRETREKRLIAGRAWQFAADFRTEDELEAGIVEFDLDAFQKWHARWAFRAREDGVTREAWLDRGAVLLTAT